MFFIIIFIIFCIIAKILYSSYKIKNKFAYLSFILGLYQVIALFHVFKLIFTSISNDIGMIIMGDLILLSVFEFLGINVYIVFLYMLIFKKNFKYNLSTIINDTIQIFLPVILLLIGIRILIQFDIDANQYSYLYLIKQYGVILLFKLSYILSHNIIMYLRNYKD